LSGATRMARRGASLHPRSEGLVGLDFARRLRAPSAGRPLWLGLVAGLLAGGLLLVVLRIDIIRLRYALAQALEREAQLRGEQRELIVTDRRLRQPARLAGLAAGLGYDRPEVVVRLPESAAPGETTPDAPPLPSVAAARGETP